MLSGITLKEEPVPTDPKEPFWKQPAFWVTLLLLPLVYIVTLLVLWPGNGYTPEVKIMVITAVGVGLLTAITGFWLASSYSSGKKDDTIATAVKAVNPPTKDT